MHLSTPIVLSILLASVGGIAARQATPEERLILRGEDLIAKGNALIARGIQMPNIAQKKPAAKPKAPAAKPKAPAAKPKAPAAKPKAPAAKPKSPSGSPKSPGNEPDPLPIPGQCEPEAGKPGICRIVETDWQKPVPCHPEQPCLVGAICFWSGGYARCSQAKKGTR